MTVDLSPSLQCERAGGRASLCATPFAKKVKPVRDYSQRPSEGVRRPCPPSPLPPRCIAVASITHQQVMTGPLILHS